jgi:hypothetical protein
VLLLRSGFFGPTKLEKLSTALDSGTTGRTAAIEGKMMRKKDTDKAYQQFAGPK